MYKNAKFLPIKCNHFWNVLSFLIKLAPTSNNEKKPSSYIVWHYNFMVCVLWLNNINSSPCRQKIYTKMVSSLCSGEKSALFKYSRTSLSLTWLSRASHYLKLKLFYLGYTFLVSYYQLHVSWTPNISNYFLFPLRVRDSRIQL